MSGVLPKVWFYLQQRHTQQNFCHFLHELKQDSQIFWSDIEKYKQDEDFQIEVWPLISNEIDQYLISSSEEWKNSTNYLSTMDQSLLIQMKNLPHQIEDLRELFLKKLVCQNQIKDPFANVLFKGSNLADKKKWPNLFQDVRKKISNSTELLPKIKKQYAEDSSILCLKVKQVSSTRQIEKYLYLQCIKKKCGNNLSYQRLALHRQSQENLLKENYEKYHAKWGDKRQKPPCLAVLNEM